MRRIQEAKVRRRKVSFGRHEEERKKIDRKIFSTSIPSTLTTHFAQPTCLHSRVSAAAACNRYLMAQAPGDNGATLCEAPSAAKPPISPQSRRERKDAPRSRTGTQRMAAQDSGSKRRIGWRPSGFRQRRHASGVTTAAWQTMPTFRATARRDASLCHHMPYGVSCGATRSSHMYSSPLRA